MGDRGFLRCCSLFFLSGFAFSLFAQLPGRLSGNFSADLKSYETDEAYGATSYSSGERVGINSYLRLNYDYNQLRMGARYEGYMPALMGIDVAYNQQRGGNDAVGSSRIFHRFVEYNGKPFAITAGNFYEQFGTGVALRTYWEPDLGLDSSLDGLRVKYQQSGVRITGLLGRMRRFFSYEPGILSGADAEINVNEWLALLDEQNLYLTLGASMVNRYTSAPLLYNEEAAYRNVLTTAYRADIGVRAFQLFLEYANKDRDFDPSFLRPRRGWYLHGSAAYTRGGLGISASFRQSDHMEFQVDRNDLNLAASGINFVIPVARINTYRLLTLYPYVTQPNNETGMQWDLTYFFKPNSTVGGRYGTAIALNYSKSNSLNLGRSFFVFGNNEYYENANVEVSKHLRAFKVNLAFSYVLYNLFLEGKPEELLTAYVPTLDILYKIGKRASLRVEGQYAQSTKDNWAYALAELGRSPHWLIFASDEYNIAQMRHYYNVGFSYVQRATRASFSYGTQREGLICVGGVCRFLPASKGYNLSLSTTF